MPATKSRGHRMTSTERISLRASVPVLLFLLAALATSGALASAIAPNAPVRLPVEVRATGWNAGYSGVVPTGHISALWMETVVPTVVCQPELPEAQFVGIQASLNGSDSSVGMNMLGLCYEGSTSPEYASLAYDCYNGPCSTHVFSLTLSPGDRLSYSIAINATGWIEASIDDLSSGANATWAGTVPGALEMNGAHWTMGGPNSPCSRSKCAQALAHFTTKLVFEQCHVIESGSTIPVSELSVLTHWTLVDSKSPVLAKASKLTNGGTEFTVKFSHST